MNYDDDNDGGMRQSAETQWQAPDAQVRFRFWSFVRKEQDCWIWTGGKAGNGYGVFTVKRRNVYAHRFSWTLANEADLERGSVVMHSCDTPACVNPAHLTAGSQRANLADMRRRGRSATGERHRSKTHPELVLRGEGIGNSKLTDAQILEIRSLYVKGTPGRKSPFSLTGLARRFGVSFQHIHKIIQRTEWAHL